MTTLKGDLMWSEPPQPRVLTNPELVRVPAGAVTTLKDVMRSELPQPRVLTKSRAGAVTTLKVDLMAE